MIENLKMIEDEIKQLKKLKLKNKDNIILCNYIEKQIKNKEKKLNVTHKLISSLKIKKYLNIIIIICTCIYYLKNKDLIKEKIKYIIDYNFTSKIYNKSYNKVNNTKEKNNLKCDILDNIINMIDSNKLYNNMMYLIKK